MVTELFYQGLWGHCDEFDSEDFDHGSVTLLLKGLDECAGHGSACLLSSSADL